MAITPNIEIRQGQNLVMTQKLQQAIKLLQMSSLEIEQFVDNALEENPFLEREDDKLNSLEDSKSESDSDNENPLDDEYNQDSWDKADKDNNFDANDSNWLEKTIAKGETLREHISTQINSTFKEPTDCLIAFTLLEHLEPSGYFTANCKEIAENIGTDSKIIEEILKKMQQFTPCGVFARNIKECLELQLKDINRYDPIIAKLLDNLELLAKREFQKLKKICGVDDEDLKDMIADIKSLNPYPSSEWDFSPSPAIIPDVFIKKDKLGRWFIEINQDTLPKVLINRQYLAVVKDKAKTKEEKHYTKERISNASWLIKAIHQRTTTILKVTEEIVRIQQDFFEKGISALKPMGLKDIAGSIGAHESTISRVTSNKYLACPRGIFELKYFFSSALSQSKTTDNTSSSAVKHKIKNYIESEADNGVLSDEDLAILLKNDGINIARRTVAKYREAIGIPTSAQRKRAKKLL